MENLRFEELNKIALDALKEASEKDYSSLDLAVLLKIGKVYYDCRIRNIEKIKVFIPKFTGIETVKWIPLYFSYIDFLIGLNQFNESIESYEDKALLNVFLDNKKPKDFFEYKLRFLEKKDDVIKWESDTLTHTNVFLPVFYYDEMVNEEDAVILKKYLFPLFKEIRRLEKFNRPFLINLDKKHLVLINKSSKLTPVTIPNFHLIEYDNNQLSQETNDQEDLIREASFDYQYIVRFPYNRNIKDRLTRLVNTSFELEFNNRFFIPDVNKISDYDLYLLPEEFSDDFKIENINNPFSLFQFIETNHSKELKELLREVKSEWKEKNFNKYTHPFPKYFFLFINPIIKPNEWLDLFGKSFPLARNTSLFNKIERIISLLVDLDWIKHLECEIDINFVFPDLSKGTNRSKRLYLSFGYFKKRCNILNENFTFSNELVDGKKNFILNSFDIVDIVNTEQKLNKRDKYLIPDFLFYNYNAFIPLKIFDYKYNVLNNSIREDLLYITKEQKQALETIRVKIKSGLVFDYKEYNKRFNEVEKQEELEVETNLFLEDESDIDENEESMQIAPQKLDYNEKQRIYFELCNGNTIELKEDELVITKRNNYLLIEAKNLGVGDCILLNEQIKSLSNSEEFYLKLMDIPQPFRSMKYELGKIDNIFEKLRKKGLSITGKNHFKVYYTSDNKYFDVEKFSLPRKQKDCELICEELNISSKDMKIAYVARYSKKIKLNNLYKDILTYLVENNCFGNISSQKNNTEISKLLGNEKYKKLFESDEKDLDVRYFIESALSNILNQLDDNLIEIKKVKHN